MHCCCISFPWIILIALTIRLFNFIINPSKNKPIHGTARTVCSLFILCLVWMRTIAHAVLNLTDIIHEDCSYESRVCGWFQLVRRHSGKHFQGPSVYRLLSATTTRLLLAPTAIIPFFNFYLRTVGPGKIRLRIFLYNVFDLFLQLMS